MSIGKKYPKRFETKLLTFKSLEEVKEGIVIHFREGSMIFTNKNHWSVRAARLFKPGDKIKISKDGRGSMFIEIIKTKIKL